MSSSAISTTKSKSGTLTTYAGLRFMGDRLDPGRVSAVIGTAPTLAYRKGEIYKRTRTGHEVRGRSGMWLLSTRRQSESLRLEDHLEGLLEVVFPKGSSRLIEPLRTLMEEEGLEADITCFWYGEHGAKPPVIPEEARAAFAKIGATIETDFQTD